MSKPTKSWRKREIDGHALSPESLAMSYGYDPMLSEGAIKPPIFQTSTFAFKSAAHGERYFDQASGRAEAGETEDAGLAYTRINNPDLEVLEDRLTLYDNAEDALAFSSGMGAISTALMAFAGTNSSILSSNPVYGGTETLIRSVLPRYGVQSFDFMAYADEETIYRAAKVANDAAPLQVIYTETPANPTNILVDLEACIRVADRIGEETGHRPVVMTDNTMLGPIGQTPIDLGVDIALYSLTKYIGGHSDLVAGAALGRSDLIAKIRSLRTIFGTTPDPHTCWLLMRSLETVKLRMERAFDNASICARFLADHPKVTNVRFPELLEAGSDQERIYKRQCTGPGSTFSFDVDGGKEGAFRFLDALKLVKLAVSLGGTESLACHPGSTTHSGIPEDLRKKFGFTPGLVRISIGIENAQDLMRDLDQALRAV